MMKATVLLRGSVFLLVVQLVMTQECNAGFTGPDDNCIACVAGKYKNSSGDALCTSCAVDTYDTVIGAVSNGCQACPVGTRAPLASGSVLECQCGIGWGLTEQGTCQQCAAGKYKDLVGNSECIQCLEDHYSSGIGATESCTACPTNSIAQAGSTTLADCTCDIATSGADGDVCTLCPLNTYKNITGSAECIACPAEASSPVGSTHAWACVCAQGLKLARGPMYGFLCMACPANSRSPADSLIIEKCVCNAGSIGHDGGPCTLCEAGTYNTLPGIITNFARTCGAPYYKSTCPAQQFPTNEENERFSSAGWAIDSDDEAMLQGMVNSFATASHTLSRFVQNIYLGIAGMPELVWDPNHGHEGVAPWWRVDLQQSVIVSGVDLEPPWGVAYPGLIAATEGFSIYVASHEGNWSDRSNICVENHPALISFARKTGREDPYHFNHVYCTENKIGRYVYMQIKHPLGQYDDLCLTSANVFGRRVAGPLATCTICPPNSVSPAGSISVTDCVCKPGWVGANATLCLPCAAGMYSSEPGAEVCMSCPAYSSASGAAAHCVCDAGLPTPACVECVAGKYHLETADVACTNCTTGQHFTGICVACVSGKYKSVSGTSECTVCPANSGSRSGSDNLSDCHCHVGFHGPHGGPCNLTEITCLDSELTNAAYTCGSDKSTNCPVASTKHNSYAHPRDALYPDRCYWQVIFEDEKYAYVEIDLGIPRMVRSIELPMTESQRGYVDGSNLTLGSVSGCTGVPCGVVLANTDVECNTIGRYVCVRASSSMVGGYLTMCGISINTCPVGYGVICPANTHFAVGTIPYTLQDCVCDAGWVGMNGTTGSDGCTQCLPGTYNSASSGSAVGGAAWSNVCQACATGLVSSQGSTSPADCVCPAASFEERQFKNESMVSTENTCHMCPANTVSLEGSTSVEACECPAGSFEETRVLNPPETHRSYSSIDPGHEFSELDNLHYVQAWVPETDTVGEWMEIDTGEPMEIIGIISQGRGPFRVTHYVTSFQVQYRSGDSIGTAASNTAMTGTFYMTDNAKKEHIFTAPIYARYVRILPLTFNV